MIVNLVHLTYSLMEAGIVFHEIGFNRYLGNQDIYFESSALYTLKEIKKNEKM